MAERSNEPELFGPKAGGIGQALQLRVVAQADGEWVDLIWTEKGTGSVVATAHVCNNPAPFMFFNAVTWTVTAGGKTTERFSSHHRSSIRSQLKRLREEFPVQD